MNGYDPFPVYVKKKVGGWILKILFNVLNRKNKVGSYKIKAQHPFS